MTTDIKLDQGGGTWILAEAAVLKTTAADVMIDSQARRGGAGGPFRRALVHGSGDALVLNFAGDYTGGVVVQGPMTAGGPLSAAGDVSIAGRLHLRSPQHSPHGEVTDVQQFLASLASLADDARRRLDRLEDRLTRLTAFIGAAEVPDWKTRTEVEQGDEMGVLYPSAAELGLVIDYVVLQREPGYSHEEVVSISPPPGTLAARGSTVVVTLNLEG